MSVTSAVDELTPNSHLATHPVTLRTAALPAPFRFLPPRPPTAASAPRAPSHMARAPTRARWSQAPRRDEWRWSWGRRERRERGDQAADHRRRRVLQRVGRLRVGLGARPRRPRRRADRDSGVGRVEAVVRATELDDAGGHVHVRHPLARRALEGGEEDAADGGYTAVTRRLHGGYRGGGGLLTWKYARRTRQTARSQMTIVFPLACSRGRGPRSPCYPATLLPCYPATLLRSCSLSPARGSGEIRGDQGRSGEISPARGS